MKITQVWLSNQIFVDSQLTELRPGDLNTITKWFDNLGINYSQTETLARSEIELIHLADEVLFKLTWL